MPIERSYMCEECGHYMNVTLTMEQVDDPAPDCPVCQPGRMQQDFKPIAIGNSVRGAAEKLTENILREDYGVANMQRDHRPESTPTQVRYQTPPANPSRWGIAREALEAAVSAGRQSRMKHGSGLDILQQNLRSGAEPDLIALSKKRAMRVY